MGTTWTNDDGLVVRYGPQGNRSASPGVNALGQYDEISFVVEAGEDLPTALQEGQNQATLREGDTVVSCLVHTETAFSGGGFTDLEVGYITTAGALNDDDAFVTAAQSAGAATGIVTGTGALIDTVITVEGYVDVTYIGGTPTAGKCKVVLTVKRASA